MEVYAGIAGQHIKSLQHQGILTLADADKEIAKSDLKTLLDDMYRLALPPGDKILHILPQEYTVDDEEGILDPVGTVSYTHLRAHETPEHLVCRLLLEKK